MNSHRLIGLAAIGSALLVIGILLFDVLIYADEGTTEFFLIAAPFLLAPAMLQMARAASAQGLRILTWVSLIAFGLVAKLSYLHEWFSIAGSGFLEPVVTFLMWPVCLMGVVLIWANSLAMQNGLPRGLAILGIIAGATWTIPLLGAIWSAMDPTNSAIQAFAWLFGLAAPIWLVTHLVYSVWLGIRFMPRNGIPQSAAGIAPTGS